MTKQVIGSSREITQLAEESYLLSPQISQLFLTGAISSIMNIVINEIL